MGNADNGDFKNIAAAKRQFRIKGSPTADTDLTNGAMRHVPSFSPEQAESAGVLSVTQRNDYAGPHLLEEVLVHGPTGAPPFPCAEAGLRLKCPETFRLPEYGIAADDVDQCHVERLCDLMHARLMWNLRVRAQLSTY